MALARRWIDPAVLAQLRQLTLAGDRNATKALRKLTEYRAAPMRSEHRRFCRRAFERHAIRALGSTVPKREES